MSGIWELAILSFSGDRHKDNLTSNISPRGFVYTHHSDTDHNDKARINVGPAVFEPARHLYRHDLS